MQPTQSPLRPMGERRFGRWNSLGLRTLIEREIRRFSSVWTQTLLAPLVTALLFMLVFTLAIGTRRGEVQGVPFAQFLAPGILMMTVIQNAFANTTSSIVISKVQGNIVDTLMPPLSPLELVIGYVAGGVARGVTVAIFISLVVFPLAGLGIAHPVMALVFAILAAACMSCLGILAGILAQKFDQMAALTNFVVTPLSFLSGTFYSITILPGPLQVISHVNPLFYMIDGMRHSVLGTSDASPVLGMVFLLVVNLALMALAWRWFSTGYRLKP